MVEKPPQVRLLPLDSVRGIAALCVATFSHYENFFGDHSRYPFMNYRAARGLYKDCWLLVDFFFLVSGVVITYRYFEQLQERRTAAREFFLLRMSRLYPLHVVMLCVTAAVQWSRMQEDRPLLIYFGEHNLSHFVYHLFFLHSGWFDGQWTYNMPTWSVCSEVFAYIVFFVLATRCGRYYALASICAVLFGILGQTAPFPQPIPFVNAYMGRGLVGFFLGSVLVFVVRYFDRIGKGGWFGAVCLLCATLIVLAAIPLGYDAFVGGGPLPSTLTVFPLVMIASLKVRPLAWLLSLRPLVFLGDISYSVYLVHVPMQMIALDVFEHVKWTAPSSSVWFMLTYVASVVAVGTVTHYTIEKPAQRWLRKRLALVG
jgi:peptidoglycan/LPS O-acetylase OafA/YrhL